MDLEWSAGAVDRTLSASPPEPSEWVPVTAPEHPRADSDHVAYRAELPAFDGSDRGLFSADGIEGGGTLWLDGDPVTTTDLSFEPIRLAYDATRPRELIVECECPPERDDRRGTDSAFPVREPIDVSALPPVGVVDLTVQPVPTADPPRLDAVATVDTAVPVEDRLTLSVRPENAQGHGTMERVDVRIDGGTRTTVSGSVDVPDAAAWWPHDLGQQARYLVTARLDGHQRQRSTGLCTVTRERDALRINGRPYRARGVTVTERTSPDLVVERALDANATLVRVRGHAPPRDLHRRCDEAGLLVWQDLPNQGSFDPDRWRPTTDCLVRRYGHHPSVVCYGIRDDPKRPFDDRIGDDRLSRARFRWRVWRTRVDRAGPERVGAAVPGRAVSLPVTGQPGTNPDASHLYPGWNYGGPAALDWIVARYPELLSAVGAFGAASIADGALEVPEGIDESVLSAVSDPDDPPRTQRDQARIVRRVADGIRRHGAAFTVVDRLFDESDAGGFGICTADGSRKPALDALARAFEPVQAVLGAPEDGTADVIVVNDEPRPRDGTVEWTAPSGTGSASVAVDAVDSTVAARVDLGGHSGSVRLDLNLSDGRTVGNAYDLPL